MPYCVTHNQVYNQDGYCVYCGPPYVTHTKGGTTMSESWFEDPCPCGGNHKWEKDKDSTSNSPQERCPKCGQTKPIKSIYFRTTRVKVQSETVNVGNVENVENTMMTEGWHICLKTAKKLPVNSIMIVVNKVTTEVFNTIAQESILKMWNTKKKEWFNLPYIEFDGSVFLLADKVVLPVNIPEEADVYILCEDKKMGKEA